MILLILIPLWLVSRTITGQKKSWAPVQACDVWPWSKLQLSWHQFQFWKNSSTYSQQLGKTNLTFSFFLTRRQGVLVYWVILILEQQDKNWTFRIYYYIIFCANFRICSDVWFMVEVSIWWGHLSVISKIRLNRKKGWHCQNLEITFWLFIYA